MRLRIGLPHNLKRPFLRANTQTVDGLSVFCPCLRFRTMRCLFQGFQLQSLEPVKVHVMHNLESTPRQNLFWADRVSIFHFHVYADSVAPVDALSVMAKLRNNMAYLGILLRYTVKPSATGHILDIPGHSRYIIPVGPRALRACQLPLGYVRFGYFFMYSFHDCTVLVAAGAVEKSDAKEQ